MISGPSISDVAAIGGLIGLVISLAMLAWQTRAVARQTKISNALAGTTASQQVSSMREIYAVFIDHPELRPYFYDGKPCPGRESRRARVLAVAEMFADAMEGNLITSRLIAKSESHDDWIAYCCEMVANSPALAGLIRDHPEWWPRTVEALSRQRGSG
ncbi:hypothetical protein GCM10023193_23680 [Planotetraspora kaengkrachanensis]